MDSHHALAFFKELFESSPDAIVVAHFDGKIIAANSHALELFGYLQDELLKVPFDLLIPDFLHTIREERPEHQRREPGSVFGRRKDGSKFPVNIGIGREWMNGEPLFGIVVRDISEEARINRKPEEKSAHAQSRTCNLHGFERIIGQSQGMRNLLQQVTVVAATDVTALILGETGTGKELIARAIHEYSSRSGRAMVALNCAAIPAGLLESELFGHEKGAFTGALNRKFGRFELAHQSTLFLDEIGDLSLELQPKVLRALEEKEFERLGSARTIQADVRLVAATNRNLEKLVADGGFRSDLYYRLQVFPITIPPLRERRSDIPLLVRHFVAKTARRMDRNIDAIPADVMAALTQYDWPGNVRELENFIERAVILSPGFILTAPLDELDPAASA